MSPLALLLLPWLLVGERLAVRCWPGRMPWSLRAGLAFALATTATGSLLLVARRLALDDLAIAVLELAAAGLAFVLLRMPRAAPREVEPEQKPAPVLLRLAFAIAIVAVSVGFCLEVARFPIGGIDAIAMWTVRARMLASDSVDWPTFVLGLTETPHGNYPLLFPAVLAHLLPGDEVGWVPSALLAGCYTAGLLAVTHGLLRVVAGPSVAILGTLCVLATSRVWKVGAQQFADVPVGLYGAAAAGCLFVGLHRRAGASSLVKLAGLLLGAAASTKIEGQALAAAVVAAAVLAPWAAGRQREVPRIVSRLVLGAMPLVALVVFIRLGNPAVGEFAGSSSGAIDRLLDLGRHGVALTAVLAHVVRFGGGILLVLPIPVLLAWRRGQRADPEYAEARALLAIVLIVLFAVYHLAFVVTAHDQRWQVMTAAPRLLTQLFPILLLLVVPCYPWASRLVANARMSSTPRS